MATFLGHQHWARVKRYFAHNMIINTSASHVPKYNANKLFEPATDPVLHSIKSGCP